MAKRFRRGHQQQSGSSRLYTVIIIVAVIGVVLWHTIKDFSEGYDSGSDEAVTEQTDWKFLPNNKDGKTVIHKHYAVSYVEKHEQAEWVAYELTKSSLRVKNVQRSNDFRPDPKVRSKSANDKDYRGSGYDRGHMVPAGDMAFSREAMSETFYMSNISPQVRAFNQGIWRELEELIRNWAFKDKKLYVVTGSIFGESREQIGRTGVTVPEAYFKVLLDLEEPEQKGIGFIMPNEVSYERINTFAMSIDEVERQTGFDFFSDLMDDSEEEAIESKYDMSRWKTDNRKFKLRKDKWNKVR